MQIQTHEFGFKISEQFLLIYAVDQITHLFNISFTLVAYSQFMLNSIYSPQFIHISISNLYSIEKSFNFYSSNNSF